MPEVEDNGTRVHWPHDASSHTLTICGADGKNEQTAEIDIVFPILHGPWGEDGTVQGLFELTSLPYVGSGVLASALGMDKHFTKSVLEHAGLPVAAWRTISRTQWRHDPEKAVDAAKSLGLPVFVKPARAGSSVGVNKVSELAQLGDAMESALAYDDKALIEVCVVGREVEMAVLAGHDNEPPRASVPGEIIVTGREFYDFDAKYLGASGIELRCPAKLGDDDVATMTDLAVRAFTAIGADGLARVDFFLTSEGFVINEVNTMPGFTPISMFPKCWEASGISYPELIDELIGVALSRRQESNTPR